MELGSELLSNLTIFSKYSKYLKEEQRRENWDEVVERNLSMHKRKYPSLTKEIDYYGKWVKEKKVLGSMRGYQFGGRAIERNPSRGYNCSFGPIDNIKAFSEMMFLLLSGCGVGYSVQLYDIAQLPEIKRPRGRSRFLVGDNIEGWSDAVRVLIKAFFEGSFLPDFDLSDIRPEGTPLEVSGGKAPGPEPLRQCLLSIYSLLKKLHVGEKIKPIQAHDICCFIANAVLAGGLRRSSLVSLFSIDDEEMVSAKYGEWWKKNPQRALANNSAVILRHRVKKKDFEEHWGKMKESGSGEPGFFFSNDRALGSNPCLKCDTEVMTREGVYKIKDLVGKEVEVWDGQNWTKTNSFRITARDQKILNITLSDGTILGATYYHTFMLASGQKREAGDLKVGMELWWAHCPMLRSNFLPKTIISIEYGGIEKEVYCCTIPTTHMFTLGNGVLIGQCMEASLRPNQYCNLCDINGSNIVDQEDLNERARAAAFIGSLQAGYTDFHYLRENWRKTTEKDALLGIGITGIASGVLDKLNIEQAASLVSVINENISKIIGINSSARMTLVKPSGTTSLVLGTSSGIHSWHSQFYLRRMRFNLQESIFQYLEKNYSLHNIIEYDMQDKRNGIITLPVAAPDGAITREKESAFDLLERIEKYQKEWVLPGHVTGNNTHSISATITVKPHEWEELGEVMWEKRDFYNNLSILPYDGGTYIQAPHEEITEEEYNKRVKLLEPIDFSQIKETEDTTTLSSELACFGDNCLI